MRAILSGAEYTVPTSLLCAVDNLTSSGYPPSNNCVVQHTIGPSLKSAPCILRDTSICRVDRKVRVPAEARRDTLAFAGLCCPSWPAGPPTPRETGQYDAAPLRSAPPSPPTPPPLPPTPLIWSRRAGPAAAMNCETLLGCRRQTRRAGLCTYFTQWH